MFWLIYMFNVIKRTILYLCEKVGESSGFIGFDRNTASSSRFTDSAWMALWDRVKSPSQLSLGGVHGTGLDQRGRKDEWRKERSLQPKHTTNYRGKIKNTFNQIDFRTFEGPEVNTFKNFNTEVRDFCAIMYLADGGQSQRSLCKHEIHSSFPSVFPDRGQAEKLRNCGPLGWVWAQHHL